MHRRRVHRLNAPQVEHHVLTRGELRLQRGIQLVRRAEEEAPLQLDDDRLLSARCENRALGGQSHPLRELLRSRCCPAHDAAAQLLANEEQDRERDANPARRDQAHGERRDRDRRDHEEVEHRGTRAQVVEAVPVNHLGANDDQDAGERGDRHPRDQRPEREERHERHPAFEEPRALGGRAAIDVHQRRAHGARSGNAANRG